MLRAYSAPFSLPGSTEPARNNPLFCTFSVLFRSFFGTFCPFRVPFLPLSVPFPSCPCIFCAWSFPFLHFRAWLFFRALRRPLPCLPYCGKFRNMDCHGIARNTPASYLHHVRHGSARSCKREVLQQARNARL